MIDLTNYGGWADYRRNRSYSFEPPIGREEIGRTLIDEVICVGQSLVESILH